MSLRSPGPPPAVHRARRRPLLVAMAAVVLVLAAAGAYGLWYLFLSPAGPVPVGGAPVGSVEASVPSSSPLASGGLSGDWAVDTSIGSPDDWTDSFVGYRVQEQLAGIGANTAVGRTPNVTGSVTIDGTRVTGGSITADLTSLRSDDDRRDGQLRRHGLQTAQFPSGSFTLGAPIDLGSAPTDGEKVSVMAPGQLTLHGVARDVDVPLTAWLSGSTIVVQGSLPITFADYGIDKPSSFAVLSVADQGTLELQLFLTKA